MPHTGWFYEDFFDPLLGVMYTYYHDNQHQGELITVNTQSIFDQHLFRKHTTRQKIIDYEYRQWYDYADPEYRA